MGGNGPAHGEVTVAEGVRVRYDQHGKPLSIRIAFMYGGRECKEPLVGIEPTAPNIRYAVRLRGEILNKIAFDRLNPKQSASFVYGDYFPESARAAGTSGGPTVSELLDAYEARAREALEESTWAGYKKIMERNLRPWFGRVPARDLTGAMIEEKLLAADIVVKTARNIMAVLSMAFRHARIEPNPVQAVDLDVVWPRDRWESDWKPDPFSFEEMTAIFAAGMYEGEADYWRVAFGTGMRPSEQIALRWPRVELEGYRVRIEEARVMGLDGDALKGPKTKAGNRWIDLTQGAYEAFTRQRERTGKSDGIVFLDPRKGKPWVSETVLRKRFGVLCTKAGVRYRNPYQTRHTFASVHLAAGRPPLLVAKWMGHEGPGVLYKTYGRWIEQGSGPATRAALEAFFAPAAPAQAEIVRIA